MNVRSDSGSARKEIVWGSLESPLGQELIALAKAFRQKSPLRERQHILAMGEYMLAAADGNWRRLVQFMAAEARDKTYFAHAQICALLMLARRFPDRFPRKAKDALAHMIRWECSPTGTAFLWDFEYMNDNYPFYALAAEIVGGEYVGRADIAAHGLGKLRRYSQVMSKYGITSEFCSSCYAAAHIVPLSFVMTASKNAEARRRARIWCDFLWFELAQRWHQDLKQLAGPHSRAYLHDIFGASSSMYFLLQRILDEPLGLDRDFLYRGGWEEDYMMLPFLALAPVYCPDWVRRTLRDKPLPLVVDANTFVAGGTAGSIAVFPSELATTSLCARSYSLAAASRPWNGGWQSEIAIARWNLRNPPRRLADQRTAYARTLMDDHGPLRNNEYVTNFEDAPWGQGSPLQTRGILENDGLNCAVQKENVLLLAARVKWGTRRHRAVRHALLISDFAQRRPEIYAAGRRIASLPYRSDVPQIVVLKDGPIVMGLRPLAVSNLGRGCCTEISRSDEHLWISYWNYKGRERVFTVDALQAIRNGFVWIIEEASATTPQALHRRLAKAGIKDRVKGVYRQVSYADGEVQLGMKVHRDCPDPHVIEKDGKAWKCPVFSSPYVQGGWDRELAVGAARLEANAQPLFLRGDPAGREVAVYNLAGQPCEWTLRIGKTVFRAKGMGFGRREFALNAGAWRERK